MSASDGGSDIYEGDVYDNSAMDTSEIVDAQILPGDSEKAKLLSMFDGLRKDSTFCDVAFLCKGKLFRAHRVVVSGWSRWLRALLSESSSEEVVHLDVFEPVSFSAVLDYMYGSSIIVTVDNAESLLKVIRRLELHGLEQSMWIFLMKAIDSKNCNQLHELADHYDCPPLKLAAWRYIQQAISGPSKHLDIAMNSVYKGTGLTGPGEPSFYRNLTSQEILEEERASKDSLKAISGVIGGHSGLVKQMHDDNVGNEEDKQDEYDDNEADAIDLNESIEMNVSSEEFIRQWSKRLNAVYRDCTVNPNDIGSSVNDAVMAQGQQSMMLGSRQMGALPTERVVRTPPGTPARDRKQSGSNNTQGKSGQLTPGDIDWMSELKGFYLSINMPERLPFLTEILQANAGREEQMLSHLMMKYKRVIPESLANHLDTLQGFLEAHSEVPFRQ